MTIRVMKGKQSGAWRFLLGILAGLAVYGVVDWMVFAEPPAGKEADPEPGLSEENERLRTRVANQVLRIGALEAELAEARRVPEREPPVPEMPEEEPEELVAEEVPPLEEEPGDTFRERMAERMDRRIGAQVAELAGKYGLTEDQQTAVAEVFRARLDNFVARRRGEEVEPYNLDAALAAVLTPKQFAKYIEESQQEIYNNAELVATSQLVQFNQATELPPEVEEAVYEAVHLTAQEMMIARQSGESYDMRETLEQRLGQILTPEQMEVYRESVARRGRFGGFGFGP